MAARLNSSTYAKARAEAESMRRREKAEAAFLSPQPRPAKRNGVKDLFAMLGDIRVPQKVDRDGHAVPGRWVLPGCREATTAELYAIAKKQGVALLFTNSKGA